MKSVKVFPSALSSASYYLKDAAQRFIGVAAKRANVEAIDKWKEKTTTETQSLPSTPVFRRLDIKALHSNVAVEPLKSGGHDEIGSEIVCAFESQMTDWAKACDKNPQSSDSSAEALLDDEMETASGQSPPQKTPSSPLKPSVKKLAPLPLDISVIPKLTRSAANNRTRQLIKALSTADNATNQVVRLQELSRHLTLYPEAVGLTLNEGALPAILKIRDGTPDRLVAAHARQSLALLGYVDPPKGRGIRILSIDGGGMRGIVILEILRHIESSTGQPIHKLFDLICGVSTGAIVTMLVGAQRSDLEKCEDLYRMACKNLFKSDFWGGTSRLLMTHAYYDSALWEQILKQVYGEKSLIETAMQEDMPKIMAISASMSTPKMKPYVFRNFNLPDKAYGYYDGSCKHKIWQSVRARYVQTSI